MCADVYMSLRRPHMTLNDHDKVSFCLGCYSASTLVYLCSSNGLSTIYVSCCFLCSCLHVEDEVIYD